MKILFVLPEYGPDAGGGIAKFYGNLVPELRLRGHSVRVVVADRFATGSEQEGVERVNAADARAYSARLSAYTATPQLQTCLSFAWAAWARAREGLGCDIVETTDYNLPFVPWVTSADGPPVVVQLHGSNGQLSEHDPLEGDELEGRLTRLFEMALLPCADELQGNSPQNVREWSARLNTPVAFIPPACPPPVPLSDPADMTPEGLVVGRIQCWKGAEVLCQALRLLGEEAPAFAWVGGDKPFRRRDQSLSALLAASYPDVWGRKISLLGRQPAARTATMQANARLIAAPSTWDVFNLTVTEGMNAGRVVVCSEGAGASYLIRNGINGFACPAGNPQALAESLLRAARLSPTEREIMGEAARATVTQELEPGKIAELRIERYRQVVSRPRQRQPLDSWRSDLVCQESLPADPLRFLDRLPLRRLVRYTLRRGWDYLLGSGR